jgi:hypothetical protein
LPANDAAQADAGFSFQFDLGKTSPALNSAARLIARLIPRATAAQSRAYCAD